jgi:nucleoside-diphosphate kinase
MNPEQKPEESPLQVTLVSGTLKDSVEEFVNQTTEDVKEFKVLGENERTFILIKPDAVRAKTFGHIINDFLSMGFEITKMSMEHKSLDFIKIHYDEHKDKSFFNANNEFVSSGNLIALILKGQNVISKVRAALGSVGKGGLRGKWGTNVTMNAIHASDSPETAEKEIKLWFGDC